MSPEEIDKWIATRNKGTIRYILQTGVLYYGMFMFFMMTFVAGKDKLNQLTVADVLLQIVIWAFSGAFFGTIMWLFQEWRYKRTIDSDK